MRRLVALVRGLPQSARWSFAENHGWGEAEHLLAGIADRIEMNRHAVVAASPLTFEPFEPTRIRRPGETAAPMRGITPREFFAMQTGGE